MYLQINSNKQNITYREINVDLINKGDDYYMNVLSHFKYKNMLHDCLVFLYQ